MIPIVRSFLHAIFDCGFSRVPEQDIGLTTCIIDAEEMLTLWTPGHFDASRSSCCIVYGVWEVGHCSLSNCSHNVAQLKIIVSD